MKLSILYEEESRFDHHDVGGEGYFGSGLEGTYQAPWNKLASKGKHGISKFVDTEWLLDDLKKWVYEYGVPNLDPRMKLAIKRMLKDSRTRLKLMGFIMDMYETAELAGAYLEEALKIVIYTKEIYDVTEPLV